MYNFISGQDVTWAQAEAVHRQTEGNPLFVQEVIRYLVEEGYLVREEGCWVLAEGTLPGTGIPDGLRDVVGKRLNRLSEKTSIGRLLGNASSLLGKPYEARDYYAQALEVCVKTRFRPEIALTRLELAELLLEHYPDERGTAIEHLDFAIAEFREMKMQPSLERALRHRGLLKA